MNRISYLFGALLLCAVLAGGCKDDEPGIEIIPEGNVILAFGESFTFEANGNVNWEASGGSIDASGRYVAPAFAGVYTVTAKDQSDAQNSATRKVIVTPHATLFKEMQQGGYVIYFRHTTATVGVDDPASTTPEWWKVCDSAIARQLSDTGREEAEAIGAALDNLEFSFAKAISSEFCRCRQTAELMKIDEMVETSNVLTFNVYNNEANRYEETLQLAHQELVADKLVALVSHSFPNAGTNPILQMGDAAIYKKTSDGTSVQLVQIIPVGDWLALK